MNYLAHAFLSPPDPLILMGNIWGDILKPKDYGFLPAPMLSGVERHKQIDAFTDHHEGVNQIITLIRPFQGKYTPVVADVIMDYTLSKYWHVFHENVLEEYCRQVYAIVESHLEFIPERLHPRIKRMMEHRWLESCANKDRMKNTLTMLSRRASFENKIPEAMIPYELHEHTIDRIFLTFFDDLRGHLSLQSED
ncbi:MAG: acyl carrier protein phosphodiesterase [Bacteroidota bacterium]|nr:acyl carrier protein phosphodiesterase [Bacteroidota bacterium]